MLSVLHHFNNPYKLIDFLTQKDEQTIFEIGYKDEQPVYRPEKYYQFMNILIRKTRFKLIPGPNTTAPYTTQTNKKT